MNRTRGLQILLAVRSLRTWPLVVLGVLLVVGITAAVGWAWYRTLVLAAWWVLVVVFLEVLWSNRRFQPQPDERIDSPERKTTGFASAVGAIQQGLQSFFTGLAGLVFVLLLLALALFVVGGLFGWLREGWRRI